MTEMKVWALWRDGKIAEDEARLLRQKAGEVPVPFDDDGKRDIARVEDSFLERDDAAGLAAPQIGISKRIIAFRSKSIDGMPRRGSDDYEVLINPRITQARGDKIKDTEGCLSCPDLNVDVVRFQTVKVKALDKNGNTVNRRYTGFIARVVQHEIDHLEGTLIVDRGTRIYYPQDKAAFFRSLFSEK